MGPGTLVAERIKREGKADGWKLYAVARVTATGAATLVRAGGGSYMEAKTNKGFAGMVEKGSDDWKVVDTYATDILVSNALNKAIETGDGSVSREGEA